MECRKLEITNFRGISSLKTDLDKTTLFCGPNGSGKTTVLDAFRFVFLGKVRDQAGNPIQLKGLVGPNGTEACIELWLFHAGKEMSITCKCNAKSTSIVTVPFIPGKITDVRQGIFEYFELDPNACFLALDPLALLLSNSLMTELNRGSSIDIAQLQAILGNDLWSEILSRKIVIDTADDLTSVAEDLFQERTQVNREAKTFKGAMDAMNNPRQPVGKKGALLKEDYAALKQSVYGAQAAVQDQNRLIEKAKNATTQAELHDNIHDVQGLIESLKKNKPVAKPVPDCPISDVDGFIKYYYELEEEIGHLKEDVGYLSGDCCPTCKRTWDNIDKRHKERDNLQARLTELLVQWTDAVTEHRKLQAWELSLNAVTSENDTTQFKWAEELAAAEAQLNLLNNTSIPKTKDIGVLEEDLAKFIERQQYLERLLKELDDWLRFCQLQDDVAKLAKESETLSLLIDKLNDPATAAQICFDKASVFETQCNNILGLFGYKVRVNWIDSQIEITEDGHDNSWRAISEASAGEVTLVQIAIAEVYGGNALALIDRFEGLDTDHAKLAWEFLSEPTGGRIVAMTSVDTKIVVDGVKMVWMQ